MKLHTRRSRAATVVTDWYNQWNIYANTESSRHRMYEDLSALGPDPDPDVVDAIIGNSTWTRCHCDECDEDFEMVIELGEERYYESATACICQECLLAALALFHTHAGE
jgi:hypothetical protein